MVYGHSRDVGIVVAAAAVVVVVAAAAVVAVAVVVRLSCSASWFYVL